jgi:hypothetical protein
VIAEHVRHGHVEHGEVAHGVKAGHLADRKTDELDLDDPAGLMLAELEVQLKNLEESISQTDSDCDLIQVFGFLPIKLR